MTSDQAGVGPGFVPFSPPSEDDIREMHQFDLSDPHIPIGDDISMDTDDDLYLLEAESLDRESLGPSVFPLSDQKSTDLVAEMMMDATDVALPGIVTEIDEDSDDDNYPDKHALTPRLMAVTDLAEPARYALVPEQILNGEMMRLDLNEPVLECLQPYSSIPAFQLAPVPEPCWFNEMDFETDFGADFRVPCQGEANPYMGVIVDQENALQPFAPENAQFGEHQGANLLSQQQQQQGSVDQFPFPQRNTNVARPHMVIQNFNFITAKNVMINAAPGRQDEAQ
jgi:hypothetical protein